MELHLVVRYLNKWVKKLYVQMYPYSISLYRQALGKGCRTMVALIQHVPGKQKVRGSNPGIGNSQEESDDSERLWSAAASL